ncbi:MAG: hypothetical protein H6834_14065 [Planctomycetes bacterium]|nr:hypothetical protein [Planctomycetota bacterium]
MSLSGLSEYGLQPHESMLDWAQWFAMVDSDWAHASFAARAFHGHLYRPHFLAFADEDSTGSGVEWLPSILGTLPGGNYPPMPNYGWITATGGGQVNPPVLFSVADKAGHGDVRANRVYVPQSVGLFHADANTPVCTPQEIPDVMKSHAIAAAQTTISPEPPRLLPIADLGAEQAFDKALHLRVAATESPNPSGTDPDFFVQGVERLLAPANGTALGRHESVVIHDQRIYVGSADGIVSCLMKDPNSSLLVTEARSKDLGYAVHGLVVGELGGQTRLVAASYRGLHVLSPTPLNGALVVLNETRFSQATTLYSMFVRPTNLTLAEYQGENHLFATTFGGWLLCFDESLNLVWKHHEPGIRDLWAGDLGNGGSSRESTQLVILSGREHLFTLSMYVNQAPDDAVRLFAASQTFPRRGADMELIHFDGTPAFAVLQTLEKAGQALSNGISGITLYDRSNLSEIGHLAQVVISASDTSPGSPTEFPLGGSDLAVYPDSVSSDATFLVLFADRIAVYHQSGFKLGEKTLSSLPGVPKPADQAGALTINVGEIDGDVGPEVIVTTSTGHVYWCEYADFLTPGSALAHQGDNRALAATWGMDIDPTTGLLHVISQGGQHYEVDPATGVATERGTFLDTRYVSFPWVGTMYGVDDPSRSVYFLPSGSAFGTGEFGVAVDTPTFDPPVSIPWPYSNYAIEGLLAAAFGAAVSPMHEDPFYPGEKIRLYAAWPSFHHEFFTKEMLQVWKFAGDPTESPPEIVNVTFVDETYGGQSPPRIALRHDLRTETISSMQSVAFGRVTQSDRYDLVASTFGGSVILLDANPDLSAPGSRVVVLAESSDFGCAAVGLATGDLDGDQLDEILVGTLVAPARTTEDVNTPGPPGFGAMHGYVHVLKYEPGNQQLKEMSRLEVGVGVYGLAIADLDPTTTQPEVVVATLEGDFFVYETTSLSSGPELIDPPLYHERFIGAVGAYNSIRVADLVTYTAGSPTPSPGSDGKKEVYFAGSSGLRRLLVQ